MTTTPTPEQARTIVVGVDGSDSSLQALRWALSFAPTLGASIDVVGTWTAPTLTGWEGVINWNPEADTEQTLKDAVQQVVTTDRPAGVNLVVCEGDAATILIQKAQQALMLIVGSRGHGGFAGLLLGSVSTKCAEHAACPVLVIHGNQPPPGA